MSRDYPWSGARGDDGNKDALPTPDVADLERRADLHTKLEHEGKSKASDSGSGCM